MSLLKQFQSAEIRMDRSGKKEPSTTDLRLLESSAKEVASVDACQWTNESTHFSKDMSWLGIGGEKDVERSLRFPCCNSAKHEEKR